MTDTDSNAPGAAADAAPPEAAKADAPAPAGEDAPALDGSLENIDASQLAKLVASAPDEQLAQGMADAAGRKATLDEIFRRMAEHVDPQKAKGTDAVIHFKILDRPGGGYDHYEAVIAGGACTTTDEPKQEPRVTIRVGPVDFLKLVSGAQPGPVLFMAGKLKLEGDLMFAAQVTSLFHIPQAA
jgi:putative sterol carrier protein